MAFGTADPVTHLTKIGLPRLLLHLWKHLSYRRRTQYIIIIGLMLVSALAEVVSLSSLLPFLSVLVAPERVFNHNTIRDVAITFGIDSADKLLLPITIVFIVTALGAGMIRILLVGMCTRTAFSTGADLGSKVYHRTLYQPYHVHLSRSSSEIISGVTNKINTVVFSVLLPFLTLVSSSAIAIAIIITLFLIEPFTASISALSFGLSYAFIAWISRQNLIRNSVRVAQEQTRVIKALQEGLGGIRDVLLDGTQAVYCRSFTKADQPLRRAQGNTYFIGQCPRYVMESLGVTLIAVLAYGATLREEGILTTLPVLGALALGAQRLLPAVQQIFSAWVSIVGSKASLIDALNLLGQPIQENVSSMSEERLNFCDSIKVSNVRFRYSEDSPWVLNGISLIITKGARLGVVGSTGSGKSTALDLLMGLLAPSEGAITVDGEPLTGTRLVAWRKCIAHVPQSIFLADSTVAENIAFGIPREAIDYERVRLVAKQAQIAEYIERKPEGYNALVGERGIAFSGGQRQRIGIARALYKKATVLVFDEATSALDSITEQSVMNAIEGLSKELTIIIVAHRVSTLQQCSNIIKLEYGRIVAEGSYEKMLQNIDSFDHRAKRLN